MSEQAALWEAFKERGCERAREQLILAHLGYVPLTLKRALPTVPQGVDRDDLEAEGRLAVVRAVDRFDPGRGVKFSSYLITTIRGAFMEYLRHESWAPRSAWNRLRETGEPILQLVPIEHTYEVQGDRWKQQGDEDDVAHLLVSLEPEPAAVAISEAHAAAVRRAVQRLAAHERAVILLHFYYGAYLAQIAERYGWTEARTGNIKRHALNALRRSALTAWEDEPAAVPVIPSVPVGAPLTEMEARAWELYWDRKMAKSAVQKEMGIGENYLRRLLRNVRAKQG